MGDFYVCVNCGETCKGHHECATSRPVTYRAIPYRPFDTVVTLPPEQPDPRDARIAELEREVSELREEAKASRQAEQEARDAARHSRETALHAQETLATVMNGALGDVERIAELEAALAAARADYEGLEWYAAYVVRAYDSDVAHGITPSLGIYNTVRQLESCGRPGWVERALGRRK